MRSEWKKVRLGDICDKIGSGATPRGGKEVYKEFGISLIRSQNVLDFSFSPEGLAFVDDEQAKQLDNVTVHKNDVLINITGDSVARVCIVPTEYLPARVNQHVAIVRVNQQQTDSWFVLYMLQRQKNHLLSIASTGGTRNALTKSMLEQLEINLPTLSEQQSIAATLSCLDDKIELNNKINANLESQAQAIFKSWFVDFEPFQGGGLVESELGLIPKGWRIGTVSDFTYEMKNGGTPSRKIIEYWNSNDIPWIKTGEITNKPIIQCEEYISQKGLKNSSAKLLPINSVLIALYGATAAKLGLLKFEASTNQACCALICDSPNKAIYLYLYLLMNQEYIKGLAIGSAQQNLSKDTIALLSIVIPPNNIFEELPFDNMYKTIENNMLESRTLAAIRDALLPKLMSGEIEVPIE